MAQPGQGAQIAAQTLFSASAAANAIPVAGQFASAGLAIVGGLVKAFGGRRRAKREEAKRQREAKLKQAAVQPPNVSDPLPGGVSQAPQSVQQQTAFAPNPEPPTFNQTAGAEQPTVQQVPQQNLGENF